MKKSVLASLTFGSAMALTAGVADAELNPFNAKSLDKGYQLSAHHEHADGKDSSKKDAEGSCGEDKESEGKCGEAKCGEGKCGEEKGAKDKEGKCGEGKCGG